MKKSVTMIGLSLLITVILSGCGHKHVWNDATCTQPKTCTECGETEGEALGHDWQEATCTEAKTCSICRETEGESLGHTVTGEATCTEAVLCNVCGGVVIEPLGHNWQEATCLEPKTCSVCGETEGDIGDHKWDEATCLAPKTCTVCGEITGEIAPHNFNENGICTMCGASREIELTMDNVNDFLTVTYTVEKGITYYRDDNDRRIEGSGSDYYGEYHDWYTVTVSPISNDYVFKDVQVCIGYDVSGFSDGTHHYDSIYSGQGGIGTSKLYSLSNEGILIMEFDFRKKSSSGPSTYYYKVENIMITDISGTCVRE